MRYTSITVKVYFGKGTEVNSATVGVPYSEGDHLDIHWLVQEAKNAGIDSRYLNFGATTEAVWVSWTGRATAQHQVPKEFARGQRWDDLVLAEPQHEHPKQHGAWLNEDLADHLSEHLSYYKSSVLSLRFRLKEEAREDGVLKGEPEHHKPAEASSLSLARQMRAHRQRRLSYYQDDDQYA